MLYTNLEYIRTGLNFTHTLQSLSLFQMHFPTSSSWPRHWTLFLPNLEDWLVFSNSIHTCVRDTTRDTTGKKQGSEIYSLHSGKKMYRVMDKKKAACRRVCIIKSNFYWIYVCLCKFNLCSRRIHKRFDSSYLWKSRWELKFFVMTLCYFYTKK